MTDLNKPVVANDLERLQNFFKRYTNKEIREYFKDVSDSDLKSARGIVKNLCLHKDNDTTNITILRLLVYTLLVKRFEDMMPIYSIPVDTFHDTVKFKPQIVLNFKESFLDAEDSERKYPVTAKWSFRILKPVDELSESSLKKWAKNIKREFQNYRFRKGRVIVAYYDTEKGYRLRINAFNESEARDLIERILSIQGHAFNEEYLSNTEKGKKPTSTRKRKVISGKYEQTYQKNTYPDAYVKLQTAEFKAKGMRDITLVDGTLSRSAYEQLY